MTYSDRPTSSPYQHRSEFAEQNNYNFLNKINPFVFGEMNMPGAWSSPYPYADYYLKRAEPQSTIECAVEPSCDTSKSPICATEITAGDRTIDMCRPTPPNLPMCRPLVPERLIDPGMWTYNTTSKKEKEKETQKQSQRDILLYILISLIIVLAR